jgi:cyclophilin family peptidyl-prolyl cis-trans isomerase/HEAT repeat protein
MISRASIVAVLCLLAMPETLLAQQQAQVEVLAGILAAQDARRFDEPAFRRALADTDSAVRSQAALGLGRLRDPRGVPLLAPLLLDPAQRVQRSAIFALGILGDSAAIPLLVQRAADPAALSTSTALELITAMARLGGERGGSLLSSVLERSLWSERTDGPVLLYRAALEAWRLGPRAPVPTLLGLSRDAREDVRSAAIYSLVRLRVPEAVSRFMEAASDPSSAVRAAAVRGLTRSLADSARVSAEAVSDVLARATRDDDAGVRITALRSLASVGDSTVSARVLALLDDPLPNVQVQAAVTLGDLGGGEAVAALSRVVTSTKGSQARRREALLALARLDTVAFSRQVGSWTTARDWRDRATAAEGWARANPMAVARFLSDPDPRVIAAALQAWGGALSGPDRRYLEACRPLARHRDAVIRSLAADAIGRGGSPADVPLLLEMYRMAGRDSFPEAAQSALGAIVVLARNAPADAESIERGALAQLATPENYLIRLWAEDNWPAAAAAWGQAFPLSSERTMEDYRDIVRRLQVGPDSARYPRVRVDIDQVGVVELELYGPEAPLTVANFLRLADRRYFDGQRFHRVVPNFVVQAGDPRGDGWGGPGGAIRDEINERRYGPYTVGMALSGPDTGGSQWFITLSAQPHLDGGYTVFGEVAGGVPALLRVTQGDLIRSIRH